MEEKEEEAPGSSLWKQPASGAFEDPNKENGLNYLEGTVHMDTDKGTPELKSGMQLDRDGSKLDDAGLLMLQMRGSNSDREERGDRTSVNSVVEFIQKYIPKRGPKRGSVVEFVQKRIPKSGPKRGNRGSMITLSTVTVHHEGEREVLIAATPGKPKFADTPEDQGFFAAKTLGSRVNQSNTLFSVDFPVKRRLWITIMSLALALAFIMLMVYFVVNFGVVGRNPDQNSEKNFVDIESPLQDFTEDVIPFMQNWFDSLGV
jgi:hypothetical protein